VDATINKSSNVVKAIVMKALLRIKEAHQRIVVKARCNSCFAHT